MHVTLVGAEFEENLAVRYLHGALEQAGHRVTSVVFNDAADTERAAAEIVAAGAPLCGLSMVFTYRAREFARLAARARALGYRGHLTAGGHFAAFHAEQLLGDVPAFDSIVCGEGEPILCALADRLDDPRGVAGLVLRDGARLVRTAPAVKPVDLDVLPFPPRKAPFDEYLGLPITNLLSSRGCSRNCAFCSIAAWHALCGGPRLRLRDPEALADEMAWLYRQGVRIFNFHDDNFVLDDRAAMFARLGALDEALTRRGVRYFRFAIKCRPDVVDRELFARLKELGLFRVFLGIEAGTPESLRRLGRGQTVADNERALAILNDLDLHTCFNLLVLNPESTLEDLAGNVAFLRAHPHNAMNFCRTEIYAGTPLEKRLRREGRLLGDYWGYDYVMADPRAQAAFEVLFPAFEARNYGDQGLHHLTMQIDYELALGEAFFGPRPDLRRRVKELVVDVNLDTCQNLEDLIASVPGWFHDPAARAAYAGELGAAVAQGNAQLGARVQAVLDEIRDLPQEPPVPARPSWVTRAAVGAGLAASLTTTSCRDSAPPVRSHYSEMIAARADAQPPAPRPDAGPPAEPPLGPAVLVKAPVAQRVLKLLAAKVVPPAAVELELWVDDAGGVRRAAVHRPALPADAEREVVEALRGMTFDDANVRGQRFVVKFSREEIAGAAETPKPTPRPDHLVPPPNPPPRPEMAPRPPRPVPRPEMIPRPSVDHPPAIPVPEPDKPPKP